MSVVVMAGTYKGAMLYRSDDRERWEPLGLRLEGWEVTALARDAGGRTYAAVGHAVYGATVMASDDLELLPVLRAAFEDGDRLVDPAQVGGTLRKDLKEHRWVVVVRV